MGMRILDDFDDARATGAGHTRCPDQAPGPLADGGAAAAGVRSLVERLTSELNSAREEREKAEKRARSAHSLVMQMKADHKTQELSWKRRKQTWDTERKSHKRIAEKYERLLNAVKTEIAHRREQRAMAPPPPPPPLPEAGAASAQDAEESVEFSLPKLPAKVAAAPAAPNPKPPRRSRRGPPEASASLLPAAADRAARRHSPRVGGLAVSEVVRGHARTKLPARPSDETKAFFQAVGLEASGHDACRERRRFERVETPRGFWSMEQSNF